MQLASIMPAPIMILVALRRVGGRNGELGVDLVQGVLRGRQTELILEERGFRRIPVRARQIETLCRINELLSLLDNAREVGEHGRDQGRLMAVDVGEGLAIWRRQSMIWGGIASEERIVRMSAD